jgi:hypothetical protein
MKADFASGSTNALTETVLTKDCPVGIRAYQKKAAHFAGAALATIFGLFSISFGQKENDKTVDASKEEISRTSN